MRTRGRVERGGAAAAAPDYSDHRQWIAQTRRREREQLEAAAERFARRGSMHIADLVGLDETEFDLLLSLLDEALVARRAADGSHSTRTGDGRLDLVLRRPPPEDSALVLLRTPRGLLRCCNYRVEVVRVGHAARAARTVRAAPTGAVG
jgi:hypothetical protein